MQIARHHLQTDRSERDEEEWSQNNNQQDSHLVSFDVTSAPLRSAVADRAKQRGYNPNACLN